MREITASKINAKRISTRGRGRVSLVRRSRSDGTRMTTADTKSSGPTSSKRMPPAAWTSSVTGSFAVQVVDGSASIETATPNLSLVVEAGR